ncbi:hypothetical protein FGIG_08837 [Fasciola gigantica]|uniref:Uncharacterized protein n=1 Tax=Fasciola gigantica TaxID=46835 RepID=A0A504YIY4_FASGI|nr:hypothetical protein FGIG_08837 [Fasciola gigantica]
MGDLYNAQRQQDTSEYQRRFLRKEVADHTGLYNSISTVTRARPGLTDMPKADGKLTEGNRKASIALAQYYHLGFALERPNQVSSIDPTNDIGYTIRCGITGFITCSSGA